MPSLQGTNDFGERAAVDGHEPETAPVQNLEPPYKTTSVGLSH